MESTFLRLRHVVILAAGATVFTVTACSDTDDSLLTGREANATEADDCDDDEDTKATSSTKVEPSDPAGSCCGGRGTCKDDADVDADARDKLTKCSGGGLCVPNGFVPGAPQTSCEAANGLGDGVCMSDCFGAVAERKALLGRSSCAQGELCVPCKVASKPTGACMAAADAGAIKTSAVGPAPIATSKKDCKSKKTTSPAGSAPARDAGSAPAPSDAPGGTKCCGGRGLCSPKTVVPAEHHDKLDTTECGGGDQLCVPLEMMSNAPKLQKCTGSAFLGDYEGMCLSTCLKFDMLQTFASSQGNCPDTHRCMPCEVGIPGLYTQKTGVPGCE